MGYAIKQSQTARPLLFQLFLESDHVTPATGKTPTVTLSKNGAAFASPAGAVTEIGSGWYKVAGNATDAATLGPLILHATETDSDPTGDVFDVVSYDPENAVRLGLTALPNAAADAAGGLPISDAGGLDLDARLDAAVSSRMATFTQPTGFLAATFPSDPADQSLVIAATDAIMGRLGAPAGASVSADILTKPSLAAILAGGDVDGFTVEQTLKLLLAALAGELSGAATTTIVFRAADDSKDRITATVTADGNRTALVLDAAG